MVARLHGVVLPVADTGTPIDDGRPDINGGPLGPEDTLSFAGAVMLTALLPAPEIRTQVLFARLHPPIASPMHLGVYELIDGLVRDVTDAFALHPAGDLFGRPPHFQMFDDVLAYLGRLESVFPTPLLPSDERPNVCEPGRVQIPLRRQVPVDLPDDSGVWTAETLGNRPYRLLVELKIAFLMNRWQMLIGVYSFRPSADRSGFVTSPSERLPSGHFTTHSRFARSTASMCVVYCQRRSISFL